MNEERKTNWRKCWCDNNYISSTFYNKKDGYDEEQYKEENIKVNKILYEQFYNKMGKLE
jgi:hypothetical protein